MQFPSLQAFRDFINYTFLVQCRACKKLVIEPEKVKGQKYLNGNCPNCGKLSKGKSQALSWWL